MLDGSNNSSSSSSSWDPQQPQADALAGYNGDPLLFVSDKAAADDAATNIQMPAAPLLFGYSVGLCLGSGLSEPGGAGLGTLGLSQVRCVRAGARCTAAESDLRVMNAAVLCRATRAGRS
jgi:hypothetical protein